MQLSFIAFLEDCGMEKVSEYKRLHNEDVVGMSKILDGEDDRESGGGAL